MFTFILDEKYFVFNFNTFLFIIEFQNLLLQMS